MFTVCDARDKTEEERVAEIVEKSVKEGYFGRLMEWNEPKSLIFVAAVGSLLTGASQPFFAIALSKVIAYLSMPMELFVAGAAPGGPWAGETLEGMMRHYCALMAILALATFLAMFV